MSCGKHAYGKRPVFEHGKNQNTTGGDGATRLQRCERLSRTYPAFQPVLTALSSTTTVRGTYCAVTLTGANFMPFGTTVVYFGSRRLPASAVTYLNSNQLQFVVPLVEPQTYAVRVANIYNANFSPAVGQSGAGLPVYSSVSILFVVTAAS